MFMLDMREFLRIRIPGCVQRTTGCGSHSFSVPIGHGLGSEVFSKLSDSGIYGINAVFMLARSPPPQGREGRGANGSVGGAAILPGGAGARACAAGKGAGRARARPAGVRESQNGGGGAGGARGGGRAVNASGTGTASGTDTAYRHRPATTGRPPRDPSGPPPPLAPARAEPFPPPQAGTAEHRPCSPRAPSISPGLPSLGPVRRRPAAPRAARPRAAREDGGGRRRRRPGLLVLLLLGRRRLVRGRRARGLARQEAAGGDQHDGVDPGPLLVVPGEQAAPQHHRVPLDEVAAPL